MQWVAASQQHRENSIDTVFVVSKIKMIIHLSKECGTSDRYLEILISLVSMQKYLLWDIERSTLLLMEQVDVFNSVTLFSNNLFHENKISIENIKYKFFFFWRNKI